MTPVSKPFAGTRDTISDARAYLGGFFTGEDRDNAVLALSEIATNTIRHGGGGSYEVTVLPGATATRVTVKGSSNIPALLVPAPASADRTGGRGLALVEACTTAWGTLVDADGIMLVWFDIAHTHACATMAA